MPGAFVANENLGLAVVGVGLFAFDFLDLLDQSSASSAESVSAVLVFSGRLASDIVSPFLLGLTAWIMPYDIRLRAAF